MSYVKPTCNCGGELIYNTEHVFKVRRNLLKSGKLSKRQTIEFELGVSSCYGYMYLMCKDCLKSYTFDLDDQERVVNLKLED